MIDWKPGLTKEKYPGSVLQYKFRWADWLAEGVTILSTIVTAEEGMAKDAQEILDTGTAVGVQVSGGESGITYDVTCKIVGSDGQEDERTIGIVVL